MSKDRYERLPRPTRQQIRDGVEMMACANFDAVPSLAEAMGLEDRAMQTCGYCGGSGRVQGKASDAYGPRPDYPETVRCEYCGGSGQCEDGNRLLGQQPGRREDAPNSGNPAWG